MAKSSSTITASSIKKWAYSKSTQGVPPPLKELPVVVEHADLLMMLASDQQCPQRAQILNCLYSSVGKSVSKHMTSDLGLINTLLSKASTQENTIILNLVNRSRLILKDLRKYDYVEWCDGGFVRKDLA